MEYFQANYEYLSLLLWIFKKIIAEAGGEEALAGGHEALTGGEQALAGGEQALAGGEQAIAGEEAVGGEGGGRENDDSIANVEDLLGESDEDLF